MFSLDSPASTSSTSSSSSISSTRSSPVHAASLVDPATHSPVLMQLVDIKLTPSVLDYVVECVAETVEYSLEHSSPGSGSPRRRPSRYLPAFRTFVSTIISRAEVTPATVLAALVYIARARPHLSIALEEWALERVFLGALITASKYTNDSTLKNVHWALCTGVFGKRDVGRIEREFLDVLDWELGVREADVLAHHQGLLDAAYGQPPHTDKRTRTASAVPFPAARTPAKRLSSHAVVVPELDPSSPSSSLASLSPPRTPAHSSYAAPPADKAHKPDVPMEPVDAVKGNRFHDLLRAFPIPRHHHHRGQRVAIHVGA